MNRLHRQLVLIHAGSSVLALALTTGMIVWVLRLGTLETRMGGIIAVCALAFGLVTHQLLTRPLLPRGDFQQGDPLDAVGILRAYPVRAAQLSWFLWLGLDVVGSLVFYLFFGKGGSADTAVYLSLGIFLSILCGGGIAFLLQIYLYKIALRPFSREATQAAISQGYGKHLFSIPLYGLRNKLMVSSLTLIGSALVFSVLFGFTYIAEGMQRRQLAHAERVLWRMVPEVTVATEAFLDKRGLAERLTKVQLGSGGRLFLVDVEGRDVLGINEQQFPLPALLDPDVVNWRTAFLSTSISLPGGNYYLMAVSPWRISDNALATAARAFLTLFVIVALLILAVALFSGREIVLSVRELVRRAERIANGDLSESAQLLSEDELGEFSCDLEQVRRFLRDMVRGLEGASTQIEGLSVQLMGAAQRIEATSIDQSVRVRSGFRAVESIESGLQKIARGGLALTAYAAEGGSAILELDKTVAEIDKTTDNMVELLGGIHNGLDHNQRISELIFANLSDLLRSTEVMTRNIRKFSDSIHRNEERVTATRMISGRMYDSSREGLELTAQTGKSIALIEDAVMRTSGSLHDLVEKLNNVGKLVGVIDEVADDTKLLSLNAAIIAAQAGEKGRSFGVLAENIKTLADRTNTATGQIIAMIRRVNDSSQELALGVDHVRVNVSTTRGAALSSTGDLESINAAARRISKSMGRIFESSSLQVSQSESIEQNGLELGRSITQVHAEVGAQLGRAQGVEARMQRVKSGALAVKSLSRVQAESGRMLAGDIQQIETMVNHLKRILDEQHVEVNHIAEAMQSVHAAADANQAVTGRVRREVEELRAEAQNFHRFVERFRLS